MLRNSLQHVARGSDGALFFQWRASRGRCREVPLRRCCRTPGRDTLRWREVGRAGRGARPARRAGRQRGGAGRGGDRLRLAVALGRRAGLAPLRSTSSRWAGPGSCTRRCGAPACGATSCPRRGDFTRYRVLLVPHAVPAGRRARARAGRLRPRPAARCWSSYFSGIVDDRRPRPAGRLPGLLRRPAGRPDRGVLPAAGRPNRVALTELRHRPDLVRARPRRRRRAAGRLRRGPGGRLTGDHPQRGRIGFGLVPGHDAGRRAAGPAAGRVLAEAGVRPLLGRPAAPGRGGAAGGPVTTGYTFVINHTGEPVHGRARRHRAGHRRAACRSRWLVPAGAVRVVRD